MSRPWRSEFYWLIWLAFLGLFAGKLTSQYAISLWLCCLAYLGRHLFEVNRLLVWLHGGGKFPAGDGIWEEIYFLIYRLKRRNKRRKKRLLAMLERFRTATAALPDATVVLGPRDEIDWFNEAAERMLGLRKSDIGQQIGNLLRYPKFARFLRQSDYNATISVPAPILTPMQLEIRIVPYGEDLRLLVAQDVSHLRFMERVRSDFVANVSHELRTPLTVLKGYMEALGDAEGAIPDRYLKVFRRMEEQTTRMQNLVDDLLLLTRLESCPQPQHKPVDVPALLWELCEEAKLLDEAQVTPELKVESDVDLLGVASELRSAFSNLIVNALKYTPINGQVVVRWREDDTAGACLDVEDTGPGIAPEHLPRLTERFYRAEVGDDAGNKGGTGLGLAIVKHVVSRHDGELRIRSALGRGSCFTCCFPDKRIIRQTPPTELPNAPGHDDLIA